MATTSDRERKYEKEAEELAVGPLLARANLLRMRGQWDEAVAACMEALRKAPHSGPAHLLLGEIYEAQGNIDDALSWYLMAVDHDPANTVAREKLARVEELQRARLIEQATVPIEAAAPKKKEKTIDRTLAWWDRMFPPGQSEAIARMIFAVCGVIAGLLVISAAVVYFIVLPRQRASSEPLPIVTMPSTPVVMAPPTAAAPTGSESRPQRPASSPRPTASPSPAAMMPAGPINDARLQQAVAAVSGSLFTLLAARRDTVQNAAQLEIALPTGAEEPERTKERIIRAATLAAKAANSADPRMTKVSIRAGLTVAALPQNPPGTQTVPVFAGEVPGGALQSVEPLRADLALLMSKFTSLTWTPLAGGTLGPGDIQPAATGVPGNGGTGTTPPGTYPSGNNGVSSGAPGTGGMENPGATGSVPNNPPPVAPTP